MGLVWTQLKPDTTSYNTQISIFKKLADAAVTHNS